MYNKSLHRFSVFVAICTFFLLFAGGLVTSTGSGLSVPDWPNTYGENMFAFPFSQMVGGILYEHSHRLLASFVGFLTVILAFWIWKKDSRRWMKKLGFIALSAVIVQGIFGGITVLFYLPQFVSATHATLAQTFFCIIISIALFTSHEWFTPKTNILQGTSTPTLQSITTTTTLSIFAQLIAGALLRHSESITSWYIYLHIAGAITVLYTGTKGYKKIKSIAKNPLILFPSKLLFILIQFQIGLGIASFLIRYFTSSEINTDWNAVVITVLHLATGAGMLATSVIISLRVRRYFVPSHHSSENYSFATK
jgi:cytochrome c oxidase assembly protein subunit 15